jgi:carboxypeptidase C (cathepsin A)
MHALRTALVSFAPLLALAPISAGAPAQEAPLEDASREPDASVSASGELTVEGARVPYSVQAGRMQLATEEGEPRAHVFHVAYLRDDVEDRVARPVTFCFNGGPGSSSVWLHLGLFGPRRVDLGPEGFDLAQPYRLVDNPWSILDRTDLVFIDPVTTGFSRAAEGVDDADFHGQRQDVESVGEAIHRWLSRNDRWASPVYLAGESYGTTRAAALALHLQDRYGVYPRGLVLVSSILNFQTARFDVGNDLPFVLFLPTYTATAFYHGRLDAELSRDLSAALREAEEFALGDYASALMLGDRLDEAQREAVARRLARLTGLTPEYVQRTNLRINISRFCKELRRDDRTTVGRLDSRYTGTDRDAAGERYEFDPSMAAIDGPYSTLLNDYLRRELGYESDLPYEVLTGRVQPWDYSNVQNEYLNVGEDLRRAMTANPNLRVHVANGYYDLATPYFATHYTFDHLFLEPTDRERVSMSHHEAGHMMYVKRDCLAELRSELVEFIRP